MPDKAVDKSQQPKKVRVTIMREGPNFVIKTITNTSWYIPGDHITRDTLKKVCEMPNWEVNVVDNDLIKTLVSALSNINIIP